MKTIETKIYQFGELSSEAQKKVIKRERYNITNYEWWDSIQLELSEDECYIAGIEPNHEYTTGDKVRKMWEWDTLNVEWKDGVETPSSIKFTNLRVKDKEKYAFLKWIGIDAEDEHLIGWVFSNNNKSDENTRLKFTVSDEEKTRLSSKIVFAVEKFENKMMSLLEQIKEMNEIMTSDENVKEMLENDDRWYYENGDEFERLGF
jgi:hypothetical protein